MDEDIAESDRPRRRRRIRKFKRFKPSFLNPETESKSVEWRAGETRELITKPLDVHVKNLVPWMNAYNTQNREVVLHQAALRAKARNSQNQLPNLTKSPLDLKKEGFVMKRSLSQPFIPKASREELHKASSIISIRSNPSLVPRTCLPTISLKPKLIVKGQSSISDRRDLLPAEPKNHASYSAPSISPLVYSQRRREATAEKGESSVFKYFNAGVIPEHSGKIVTISDVRKYIAYMETKHFRRPHEVVGAEEDITCLFVQDAATWLYACDSGHVYRCEPTNGLSSLIYTAQTRVNDVCAFGGIVLVAANDPHPVLVSGSEVTQLSPAFSGRTEQVAFSPTGRFFCAMDSEGDAAIFQFGTWAVLHECKVWTGAPAAVPRLRFDWSCEHDCVAFPGDFQINFLSCEAMEVQRSLFRYAEVIVSTSWIKADRFLVVLTEKSVVHLWNIESQEVVGSYKCGKKVDTLVATNDCFAFSCDFGVVTVIERSDCHLSTSKVCLLGETDPFQNAVGATLQEHSLAVETSEKETILFRSMLGVIVRSVKVSPIDNNKLKYTAVDVTFSKSDFRQNLHFNDTFDICMAHMSPVGAIFASKSVGELSDDDFVEEDKQNRKALIQYKPFKQGTEWSLKLPGSEDVEGVACGETWCAVVNSLLKIRFLSVRGGAQLSAVSFHAPIVSMATCKDVLGLLCHASLPISGMQRLSVFTYDVSLVRGIKQRLCNAKIGTAAGATVDWFGFSGAGTVGCSDSAGNVRVYRCRVSAWEIVAVIPKWKVVGISDSEVYGYCPGGKYISRRAFAQQATCPPVPPSVVREAITIPKINQLDENFLKAFKAAIDEKDANSVVKLILRLQNEVDILKCFHALQKMSPEMVGEVETRVKPRVLKRKLQKEQMGEEGKRVKEKDAPYLSYFEQQLSNPRIKPLHAPGSFSRPYSSNLSTSALDPTQAASPRSGRIEEVLMQRHRQSQSKLTQLKARIQAEEMKEVRAAPVINPTSRKIADAVFRPPASVPRLKSKGETKSSRETEHTLSLISLTKSEAVLSPPPLELRCHVSLKSGTTSPVVPAVRNDDARMMGGAGVVSIDQLRNEVLEKSSDTARANPPADFLEMSALDRQDFFIAQKKQKLAQQKMQREDDEVRGCTFRPALTPRRSLSTSRSERSVGPTRSSSATRQKASYYERYLYTKTMREASMNQTPSLKPPQADIIPEQSRRAPPSARKEPKILYQALSPTNMRIGFRSGLNLSEFISHAKPMVSYRNADIEKASKPQKAAKSLSRSRY